MEKQPIQAEMDNHLRDRRQTLGLSQKELAGLAGITRQAISALEANHYSPATSVALRLARAMHCRVEDLFTLRSGGEIVEGELLGRMPDGSGPFRAQVMQIGPRLLVRPLIGVGELAGLSAIADGLIVESNPGRRVQVKMLKEREEVRRKVVVGGCDPAMFLIGEHLRKRDADNLVPCLMGSTLALDALKRGEVHVAGIHLTAENANGWKVSDLKRSLGELDCIVVTFAHWEEGLVVRPGNPKRIRAASDLAKSTVRIVNRENGSGARGLLDRELRASGIDHNQVKGYRDEVLSHFDVAARVKAGLADVGIGVRAVAAICALEFVSLQRARYDLIIPKGHYEGLSGLRSLLDIIVSATFREELNALGGYDTRDTGKLVDMVNA
jgi:molybdate-binding protein/DNA-binding XRE family transcriptional regulator